jgi:hypothetical protein
LAWTSSIWRTRRQIPKKRPFTPEQWYSYLQDYVNSGAVVQIGLAFAFEGENPGIIAYEFNLVVDVELESYHEDSLKFLKRHKHDLAKHKKVGILPEWISAGLMRNLPFSSNDVIWIAFHGDKDVAFILSLIVGRGRARLPSSPDSFFHQFNKNFPVYFDVRVLAQMVKDGFRGKLTAPADPEYLNLKRIGDEHQAGSDYLHIAVLY